MKLRNQLLALSCLLIFIAFGFLYFHKWVEQKPFGIIIFVSDGLTTGNITAARLYNGGADSRLTLESLPNASVAILSNFSNNYAVPDSAAAASAIATGDKVNKGSISVDSKGKAIATILELAREKGRSTGLITNGNITDPGVAAFYAHSTNANDAEDLARQFADNAKINVVMGGGGSAFISESKGGLRKDGRDLILEFRDIHDKQRQVVRTKAELENVPSFLTSNLFGVFSNDVLAYRDKIDAASQQPSLSDMVRRAIEFLQYNTSGYVLVVDCELGDRAAGQNDGEHAIKELIATDEAIKTALDYVGKSRLIIAVGKHATGGMSLNGLPLRQDKGMGLLGTDSLGTPSITWATGPNGPVAGGTTAPAPPGSPAPAPASAQAGKPPANLKDEPAAFHSQQAINNADDVVAVGTGLGSQPLKGFLDNTVIFKIVKDNL